jgi:hypothetical protein
VTRAERAVVEAFLEAAFARATTDAARRAIERMLRMLDSHAVAKLRRARRRGYFGRAHVSAYCAMNGLPRVRR